LIPTPRVFAVHLIVFALLFMLVHVTQGGFEGTAEVDEGTSKAISRVDCARVNPQGSRAEGRMTTRAHIFPQASDCVMTGLTVECLALSTGYRTSHDPGTDWTAKVRIHLI
jgi:hypothetical protein